MTDSADYIRAGIVGVAAKTLVSGENGEGYCRGCDLAGNEETFQESDTPCDGCGTDICTECSNVCKACNRGLLPLETLASAFLAAAKQKNMTAAAYALELGVIPKLPVPIKRVHGDRNEEESDDEEEEEEDEKEEDEVAILGFIPRERTGDEAPVGFIPREVLEKEVEETRKRKADDAPATEPAAKEAAQ